MNYDKLEGQKNQIQEQFPPKKQEWILDKYLPKIKRGTVKSRGNQANYLQAIKKILKYTETEIQPHKLSELNEEELEELNIEIVENIQDSKYRETEGSNNKRRKVHQWTVWKKALDTEGIDPSTNRSYMPDPTFTEDKDVNHRSNTEPDDLPSPQQMKKFVKALGKVSGNGSALRNQALALLLWDKGPRIGEALNIQLKDISVQGKQVKIDIEGNKKSDDRTVEMFQGRKTLKDWIQKHPASGDSEAYLFSNMNYKNGEKIGNPANLRSKFIQARNQADLDFKVKGEPMHIFRKAMDTAHLVNEWATWEQLCTWKGKSPDSTKPDYVLMATEDVDASVAEKIGVEDDVDREVSSRLKGSPLLPVNCTDPGCGRLNRCYRDVCQYCGTELPDSEMPKNEEDKDSMKEADMIVKESSSRDELVKRLEKLEQEEN